MMKRILASLVCLAGLLLSASSAHAITLQLDALAQPNTIPQSLGSYHVTLNSADFQTWTVNIVANSGANTPNSAVHQITLNFFDPAFNSQVVNSASGATGAAWSTSFLPAQGVGFTAPGPGPQWLQADGSNQFNGTMTLASPLTVGSITVNLQDTGRQWNGNVAITPEAGAVAQFLPALLPVGLVLRRRGLRGMLRKNAV